MGEDEDKVFDEILEAISEDFSAEQKGQGNCAAFLSNLDSKSAKRGTFNNLQYNLPQYNLSPWSTSSIPDYRNEVLNTAKIGNQTSEKKMLPTNSVLVSWETYGEDVLSLEYNPTMIAVGLMDQINVTRDGSDYLWYITSLGNVPNGKLNANPDLNSNYQVVVAATKDMGTGKNGKFPWRLLSDLKIFKDFTLITSEPAKINTVVMGRKIWESISIEHQPLPGCLNVVRTGSGNPDITTARNVVIGESMVSALELLTASPYCLSIEKMFVIGGGQILREAINALGCGAIHLTEIEASIKCETFISSVDTTLFQPWYSSLSSMENSILYSFPTYVSVMNATVEILSQVNGLKCNSFSYSAKFEWRHYGANSEFDQLFKEVYIPNYIFDPKSEGELLQDVPSCPVLVFINSKDGGQLGGDLLITCRSIFNKNQ
ncbi:hypothetical protein U1Q18_022432, partial [Sarracenia purpurea var. burkii]